MQAMLMVLALVPAGDPNADISGRIQSANAAARVPAVVVQTTQPADPPPIVVGGDAKPVRAKPFQMTWAGVHERIERKKPGRDDAVLIAVGKDEKGYERVDDAPAGVKPGLYRCWWHPPADGKPGYVAWASDNPPAWEVRAAAPFSPRPVYQFSPFAFQNCGPTG